MFCYGHYGSDDDDDSSCDSGGGADGVAHVGAATAGQGKKKGDNKYCVMPECQQQAQWGTDYCYKHRLDKTPRCCSYWGCRAKCKRGYGWCHEHVTGREHMCVPAKPKKRKRMPKVYCTTPDCTKLARAGTKFCHYHRENKPVPEVLGPYTANGKKRKVFPTCTEEGCTKNARPHTTKCRRHREGKVTGNVSSQ